MKRVVVYRNLEVDKKFGYEDFGNIDPDSKIIAQGIYPGAEGFPDLHVRHFIHPDLILVTMTDEALPDREVGDLLAGAKRIVTESK